MLRQSYGEKWSILLIISRGRKVGDLMIYILKYFKKTYFIYLHLVTCFPSVKGCGTLRVRATTLM